MINIIGGGPAGLYTAYILSRSGKKVQVFEEHEKIGIPVQCTGITTAHLSGFFPTSNNFYINKIKIARIISPNKSIDIKFKNENYVIDRARFDNFLAKLAKKQGTIIHRNNKFISYHGNYIRIKNTNNNKIKKIKNKILIGADGPSSKVSKILNPNIKIKYWIGSQARIKIKSKKNTFQVFLGSNAPKFFGWIVPESEKISRVGLATESNPNYYFKKFLNKLNINNNQILKYQGGMIPNYNSRIKIFDQKKNIYLVGDAATQVKATTGGGIIPALNASKILSNSINNNLNYQKMIEKKIKKDLYISSIVRKFLNKFSNQDYDKLILMCKNKKIKDTIENHDREYPSKIVFKLLFHEPRFLFYIKKIFF